MTVKSKSAKKGKAKAATKSKAKTKAAKPAGDTPAMSADSRMVEIEAKLPLTDHEKVKRGERACVLMEERDKLILARKAKANEMKAEIDARTSEATKLLREFHEGREVRKVKAKEIRNFSARMVEYHHKGEIIHQRPMTPEDHQEPLPLKDKAPLKQVSAVTDEEADVRPTELRPAGATVLPMNGRSVQHDPVAEAHAKNENERRADVASVIREETSAKSKWSPIDGARDTGADA